MHEPSKGAEYLYAKLSADVTLQGYLGGAADPKIFEGKAPEGTAEPYIAITFVPGADLMVVGADRVWSEQVWLVKVVGKTDSRDGQNLTLIADRIDQVLHKAKGTVAGASIESVIRETPIDLTETSDGVQYRHLGGMFRMHVRAA